MTSPRAPTGCCPAVAYAARSRAGRRVPRSWRQRRRRPDARAAAGCARSHHGQRPAGARHRGPSHRVRDRPGGQHGGAGPAEPATWPSAESGWPRAGSGHPGAGNGRPGTGHGSPGAGTGAGSRHSGAGISGRSAWPGTRDGGHPIWPGTGADGARHTTRAHGTRPDLAVLIGIPDPELAARLMRERIPHLAVSASEAIGVVGPLVLPGRSALLTLPRPGQDRPRPGLAADPGPAGQQAGRSARVRRRSRRGGGRPRHRPGAGLY